MRGSGARPAPVGLRTAGAETVPERACQVQGVSRRVLFTAEPDSGRTREFPAHTAGLTAHKRARIVYLALRHGMTYVRQSREEYEAQMREEQIKAVRRRARRLGLEVIEGPAAAAPTTAEAPAQG